MAYSGTTAIVETFVRMAMHPVSLFANMNVVTRLGALIALACAAVAVVMALMSDGSGGKRSSLLATLGIVGLVAGGLGGLYDVFVTWQTMQMLHESRLIVVLPSFIEAGVAIVLGLIAWQAARNGNAGAKD